MSTHMPGPWEWDQLHKSRVNGKRTMSDLPSFVLSVHRVELDDGSPVFNVVVYGSEGCGPITLHAENEDAAYKAARRIADAINDFTVDTAEVQQR
jgi:hypothetical protein